MRQVFESFQRVGFRRDGTLLACSQSLLIHSLWNPKFGSPDKESLDQIMSDSDDDDVYGPRPPPDLSSQDLERRETIGPCMPPGYVPYTEEDDEESANDSNEDDEVIGPVLPGQDAQRGYAEIPIKSDDDSKPQREEWMTVIPKKVVKRLGFKSVTSFCKKPVVNEDEDEEKIQETIGASKRNQELSEVMDEYTVRFSSWRKVLIFVFMAEKQTGCISS